MVLLAVDTINPQEGTSFGYSVAARYLNRDSKRDIAVGTPEQAVRGIVAGLPDIAKSLTELHVPTEDGNAYTTPLVLNPDVVNDYPDASGTLTYYQVCNTFRGHIDARALLEAVRGDRLEALFTVALALELRQGEALGLRWPDIDLEACTLSVQLSLQRVNGEWLSPEPKTTRSRRTVPLPGPVTVALREHRARQLVERLRLGAAWQGERWGALVFADEAGGPLSGFHVSRRFKALLAVAGLPPMRYHDLRHGAASLMAAQGVPARVAMEILGHSQISTTMNIYAHVAPELGRDAAERIGAALWGKS